MQQIFPMMILYSLFRIGLTTGDIAGLHSQQRRLEVILSISQNIIFVDLLCTYIIVFHNLLLASVIILVVSLFCLPRLLQDLALWVRGPVLHSHSCIEKGKALETDLDSSPSFIQSLLPSGSPSAKWGRMWGREHYPPSRLFWNSRLNGIPCVRH